MYTNLKSEEIYAKIEYYRRRDFNLFKFFSKRFDPLGLYLLHKLFIWYMQPHFASKTFQQILIFLGVPSWRRGSWASAKKLIGSSITCLLNSKRDPYTSSLFLCLFVFKFFQQNGKYLEMYLIGSKATNRKTRENFSIFFLPRRGIEPRTFQS